MAGECGSCGAPIVWALTAKGARTPVDIEPSESGNTLVLLPRALRGSHLAVVLSGAALDLARQAPGRQLRTNHWATCPDKAEWRAKQEAKRAARAAE